MHNTAHYVIDVADVDNVRNHCVVIALSYTM